LIYESIFQLLLAVTVEDSKGSFSTNYLIVDDYVSPNIIDKWKNEPLWQQKEWYKIQ